MPASAPLSSERCRGVDISVALPPHAQRRFPSIVSLNHLQNITDKADMVIWAGEFVRPDSCIHGVVNSSQRLVVSSIRAAVACRGYAQKWSAAAAVFSLYTVTVVLNLYVRILST